MADYLLPDGMTAAAARSALADRLAVRDGGARVSDRAYYDTFDGLLHAAGLAAVWEGGQLALVEPDSDRIRARTPIGKPTAPLFAWDVPDGPLRAALRTLIDVRALLPKVEIHSRERQLDVLDGEQKTVVRLRLQQPALGRRRLRARVHLTPMRGYGKELARVSEALGGELGWERAARPLIDEAVTASGARPEGTPAKIQVPLARSQRADGAAAAVLAALLAVIEANLAGAIADLDSEFLHDLRVSVRRSRTVQRELRRVFPAEELARYRGEFRWLQQATGDARDLDVYVLDFEAMRALVPEPVRPDLDPVLAVLRARRANAHRRMLRSLRSERTAKLVTGWSSLLEGLERRAVDERPEGARPIGAVAGERITKVYRRMVRMGEAIEPFSPSAQYHELRKQGKELRYLLELFGAALYPAELVKPMIKALKSLQDVLGRHQDREVQVITMRSLSEEVSGTSAGAATLMAMGVLIERLDQDQRAARAAFAPRFREFASPAQRKLVRDAFR